MGPLLIPQAAQQNVGITALAPPARLSARALSVPRSASVRRTREEETPAQTVQAAPAARAAIRQVYDGIDYYGTPRAGKNPEWKTATGGEVPSHIKGEITKAYKRSHKGAGYGGNFFGDLINTIF